MRTKNALKTFIYGIFFTIIIAILGLIKTKVLLKCLGDEYVGIYQLFYQIYLYLSIVDGGVGASVTYRLYKPVSENDANSINKIMEASRRYFNKIGIIVTILGFLLSFEIMFFIKETSVETIYIKSCFVLYVISSAISYFTISHAFLYESEQKLYKSSNLNHALTIAESICAIIIAYMGGKLLTILISFVLLSICKNIILLSISKKDHKYLKKVEEIDDSFKKDANNLIIKKISTLVFENSGVMIISKFLGLTSVIVYNAYNQIITMLKLIIQRLNSALLPSVGNLLVSENKKAKNIFEETNSLSYFISNSLFAPLFFMLNPFISLWYGDKYVSSRLICLLFVVNLYLQIIKIPLDAFINAAGKFKEIRKCSIYESVGCVFLSILLVKKYGISGILLSTMISMFFGDLIIYTKIVCKKIVYIKISDYIKKVIKYLIGLAINVITVFFIGMWINVNSLIMWLVKGIILFLISVLVNFTYFYITKELLFFDRLRKIIKVKIAKK